MDREQQEIEEFFPLSPLCYELDLKSLTEISAMSREAIEHIYRENAEELTRHADRILGDGEDARDVVQEAFVKLWQMDRKPDKPKASLFVAIRNLCIDRLRRKAVRPTVAIEEIPPDHEELEASNSSGLIAERFQTVEALINSRLSPRDREILMLHDYKGWEYEEIAEHTGLEPTNIRVIVSRARKLIRQAYFEMNNLERKK